MIRNKQTVWSGEQFDDRMLSNGHLSLRNSFNQTLLQDDNNDEKYKKWSGQASSLMIDGRQTDTYLFEIPSARLLIPTAWIWGERHEKGTFWRCLGCWMWIREWQVNKVWSHGLLCNQNQQGRLKPNSSLLQSKHHPKSKVKPFL